MTVTTMDQIFSNSVGGQRFNALLLSIFGALALGLAVVGVFGVINYSVAQRTHELGVRIALGAKRRDIFKLVVRQAMLVVSIGLGIGVLAAIALSRALASQLPSLLFGVRSTDPATFVGMVLLLTLTALAACYFPARRAIKVEPTIALRAE